MAPNASENTISYDERYIEYVELFNERYFYDCHEVLEDLWLDDIGPARRFYQGLIHLATAFQHLFRGNRAGAEQRFRSTLDYLSEYPHVFEGLNLETIRANIHYWLAKLQKDSTTTCPLYRDEMVPRLQVA